MDRHCSLFRVMINDYFDGADADYGDNSADVDDNYFPPGSFSKPSKDHLTHLGGKKLFFILSYIRCLVIHLCIIKWIDRKMQEYRN